MLWVNAYANINANVDIWLHLYNRTDNSSIEPLQSHTDPWGKRIHSELKQHAPLGTVCRVEWTDRREGQMERGRLRFQYI